jgi:hypothetical protein
MCWWDKTLPQSLFSRLYRAWIRKNLSVAATLHTLSLGAADAVTGWYAKSFADTTINVVVIPKSQQSTLTGTGIYIRYDAVGFTDSAVKEGDEITDAQSIRYLVESVVPNGRGSKLDFYTLQLIKKVSLE